MGEKKREEWGSRFGLVMAAAGSAVGLGNIWRFPYITGKYGGAAFLVFYIGVVIIVGISLMLAEFALGRRAQKGSVGTFRTLGGGAWNVAGWAGFLIGFIILSYYAVIAGWALSYIFQSLTGLMDVAAAGKAGDAFGAFITDPGKDIAFFVVVMAVVTSVVARGLSSGIEKFCKVLMPALFLLLLVLIGRAVTLEGSTAGLKFYLVPDFSKLNGEGMLNAISQGFYSLSLAMGIMVTYGSYISKEEFMPKTAGLIVGLDTMVAFLSGLVIFPAAFAFGIEPNAGPGLTFITLPAVFAQMGGGAFFSCAFFTLLFIAAITSAFSLFEVTVSFAMDELKMSRVNGSIVMGVLITILGIPSAVCYGMKGLPKPLGMDWLDAMDFLTNNFAMPLLAIVICIFVGWFWHKDAKLEITNEGTKDFALYTVWLWICRVVAPALIAVVFYQGALKKLLGIE